MLHASGIHIKYVHLYSFSRCVFTLKKKIKNSQIATPYGWFLLLKSTLQASKGLSNAVVLKVVYGDPQGPIKHSRVVIYFYSDTVVDTTTYQY